MGEIACDLPVAPEAAWAVVIDPLAYPRWLVGAAEVLGVDLAWPEVGAAFRHRVGLGGPVTVGDSTSIERVDAPRLLQLDARER